MHSRRFDSNLNTESDARCAEDQTHGPVFDVSGSVSGSVSSSASGTSDSNTVKEFKASLYEKKIPFTVKLLKYTIWLLYGVLLAATAVDWAITYIKADKSRVDFDLISSVSDRLDHLSVIALDTRMIAMAKAYTSLL
ncbi:MAG: hypothetical protein P4M11_04810 [Candidatus Pacebacteria bacterium]|nr:hypothetical protein [Candidatus Paceibacterota bacterium]